MSFFLTNKHLFQLEPANGRGLRECQLGAVWALKSHFTTTVSNEIASLISMPTGSGKTALMMATCFELSIPKVLIIVSSQILRRQICEQFSSLQILKDNGCLPADIPALRAYEVESRQTTTEAWEQIISLHDVIVAHPNSISPYYKGIVPPPKNLIGAIFIDEAHHSSAPTWKDLNNYYIETKRVFFTATPFRRDKKRMQAKLIYHYSLAKALDRQILRPITFQGIASGLAKEASDAALIQTALDVLNRERVTNQTATILIRTDKIDDAVTLTQKYRTAGIRVDCIHSKRPADVNAELIQNTRDNQIDGLVCVGIASEGLDIPNLKVAVLHSTPRSIPYTIQFLGRISRSPIDQEGPATLIANLDEVRGEVTRLYRSDEAWSRLIPSVIENQILTARHYRSSQANENDFLLPEINVFFSALIYEVPNAFEFKQDFINTTDSNVLLHVEQESTDSPLVIITTISKPLDWAKRSIYIDDYLDIHVFYHSSSTNLLFELSTSDLVLSSFRDNLIPTTTRPISHGKLYSTLSTFNQEDYIMVGMKNATMRGSAQPSYKTVMGNGVQTTVRASEGRVFSTGHALLKIDTDNTWGIATKKGRVWAMKRGTIEEFQRWCDQLASLVQAGNAAQTLPGLSFLAKTSAISTISELPLSIILDDMFFRARTVIIDIQGTGIFRNAIPILKPINIDPATGILHCTLKIDSFSCVASMDLHSDIIWNVISQNTIAVRAERNENNIVTDSIQGVLNKYPPSLIMPNGEVIEGRNCIIPNRTIEILPSNLWQTQSWGGCDIMSERYDPQATPPNLPVINKTVELIRPKLHPSDVLILDDGANEISDLIWIQDHDKIVNLIHCKPSKKPKAGCRVGDSDILFAQALRSIHWVSSSILLDRLNDRISGGLNSKILIGASNFQGIFNTYKINEWRFNIILSQPGFKRGQVSDPQRSRNNVYELAIPMFERIRAGNATLEIWCTG
jgi:superfamily II DNA or RNA helicase